MRLILALLLLPLSALAINKLVWPTPSTGFIENKPITLWVQPTGSGIPESGLYGCMRTNGYQFHEGLDIAPTQTDRRGNALDNIYAALDGKVVYANAKGGLSTYGIYVVIEHKDEALTYYTLYAHMSALADNIKAGVPVVAGQIIGTMGHTASNGLPRSRSHLHIEFALQLSNNFQWWYDLQKYKTKNRHSNYNGRNFIGWNPIAFYDYYRRGKLTSVKKFVRSHATAVSAIVRTNKIPWFIRQNPGLLSAPIPENGVKGWQIEFSDVGIPKLWTPLTTAPEKPLLLVDGTTAQAKCRKLKEDDTTPGKSLESILELLFTKEF